MFTVGQGVEEIRVRTENAYRVFYVARFSEAVYVLHAFQRKPKRHPKKILRLDNNVTSNSLNIDKIKTSGEKMDREQNLIVTQSSENIFDDLGFDRSQAANLKIRADLMLALKEYIQSQGWTQEQAAEFFQETQPRISNLINGEISRFSVDKLINMLSHAGMKVEVEVLSIVA